MTLKNHIHGPTKREKTPALLPEIGSTFELTHKYVLCMCVFGCKTEINLNSSFMNSFYKNLPILGRFFVAFHFSCFNYIIIFCLLERLSSSPKKKLYTEESLNQTPLLLSPELLLEQLRFFFDALNFLKYL